MVELQVAEDTYDQTDKSMVAALTIWRMCYIGKVNSDINPDIAYLVIQRERVYLAMETVQLIEPIPKTPNP